MSKVFDGATADGNSASDAVRPAANSKVEIVATGTFGSGTVRLQQAVDNALSEWVNKGTGLTAAGSEVIEIIDPNPIRVNISGSTAPSLNVWLFGADQPTVVNS